MLNRPLTTYAALTPRAVSDGSPAQVFAFVEDAKHDIAELAAALRTARDAISKTECPHPITQEMAVDCLKFGECGCCYGAALKEIDAALMTEAGNG